MAKNPTKEAFCAGCGAVFASRNRGGNRGWTRFCSNTCRGRTISYKGGPDASRRRRRYGLEPEQYEAMLREQGGRCALCRGKPEYTLYVDHDHESKAVRSLLCAGCNAAVGVFDRLTWDEVLIYWGYSNHHAEGMELAWRWFAALEGEADRESGNTPRQHAEG